MEQFGIRCGSSLYIVSLTQLEYNGRCPKVSQTFRNIPRTDSSSSCSFGLFQWIENINDCRLDVLWLFRLLFFIWTHSCISCLMSKPNCLVSPTRWASIRPVLFAFVGVDGWFYNYPGTDPSNLCVETDNTTELHRLIALIGEGTCANIASNGVD